MEKAKASRNSYLGDGGESRDKIAPVIDWKKAGEYIKRRQSLDYQTIEFGKEPISYAYGQRKFKQ